MLIVTATVFLFLGVTGIMVQSSSESFETRDEAIAAGRPS